MESNVPRDNKLSTVNNPTHSRSKHPKMGLLVSTYFQVQSAHTAFVLVYNKALLCHYWEGQDNVEMGE